MLIKRYDLGTRLTRSHSNESMQMILLQVTNATAVHYGIQFWNICSFLNYNCASNIAITIISIKYTVETLI